jgi:3-hydroxy-9,10-secoandrosta-1,3,5(10)-triene-9,17-dione monooxygenase reductase component
MTLGIDATEFRSVLSHFCSGVTVVAGVDGDGPIGLTCQSFSSLSLDPPLVLICPSLSSTSWPRIAASGAFCVSVLALDQEDLAWNFANSGGDKFRGVPWSPAPSGSPVLDRALAWIDCQIEKVYEGGDHIVVMGRVLALRADGDRLPLLFFRGAHPRLDGRPAVSPDM